MNHESSDSHGSDDPEGSARPARLAFRRGLSPHIQGCQDALAALEGLSGNLPARELRNSPRRGGPLDKVVDGINLHPFLIDLASDLQPLALGAVARVKQDLDAAHRALHEAQAAILSSNLPRIDGDVDIAPAGDRVDIDAVRISIASAYEGLRRVDAAVGGEADGFARRVGPTQPQPRKVTHVDPVYDDVPQSVQKRKFVMMELIIGIDGSVTHAEVLMSVPPFDQAALAAVRQWKFEPPRFNGLPTAVVTVVGVHCPSS